MATRRSIEVLATYKPLTRILRLYNADNFHGPDKQIVYRNIRETVLFTIFLMSSAIVMISAFAVFSEIGLDLVRLAHPLSIWLCVMQIFLSYSILVAKEEEITETIDELQIVIDSRELAYSSLR